ncbi:hypothetical protein [Myroides injenensis]|uniref:hypothetical protein n=1 Tax=Myroides injenensis TaxID=1183151 RepID=UPI000288A296|nr:hypothetical protein [Myroides injenensis]
MEDYLFFVIWVASGIFLVWVLHGIYQNTAASYFRKRKSAKSYFDNDINTKYSLYKIKKFALTISLDNITIKQHRYRYDIEEDTLALDYINPHYNDADDLIRHSRRKFGSDAYFKYQNRIDYIESLTLNEVLIPIKFDNKDLLATVILEMDRDNLAIYLALEKEVEVYLTKYIYHKDGMTDTKYDCDTIEEYECKFDFKFLKEVFEQKPIYYSAYIK